MPRKITFIHTADLHIGAPMRGFCNLSEEWAARLQRAIVEAYERVVDAALRNDVDFVVIAGDMFDASGASYGDYLRFFEGLQRLDDAGIAVYLTTGNHDPYTAWRIDERRLPTRCRLLGGDECGYALFERDGEPLCLVGARGYRNLAWPMDEAISQGISRQRAIEALEREFPRAAQAPFTIGIIHTALGPDQSKAYSNPQALYDADVDYWACGHLHERQVLSKDGCPPIVFPGCIQARDVKETGERGCYLVSIEEARGAGTSKPAVDVRFLPMASVVFHEIDVDVSACQTLADIARLVQARLFHESGKSGCDEMVERVTLTGGTELHDYLRRPEVVRDLRKRINNSYPSFYCDGLVDRTRFPRDCAALMQEGLFESHVLRVAGEQRKAAEQMVNFVQAEFVKRGIDVPSSLAERMGAFEDAAEVLVMDLLGEESA